MSGFNGHLSINCKTIINEKQYNCRSACKARYNECEKIRWISLMILFYWVIIHLLAKKQRICFRFLPIIHSVFYTKKKKILYDTKIFYSILHSIVNKNAISWGQTINQDRMRPYCRMRQRKRKPNQTENNWKIIAKRSKKEQKWNKQSKNDTKTKHQTNERKRKKTCIKL